MKAIPVDVDSHGLARSKAALTERGIQRVAQDSMKAAAS